MASEMSQRFQDHDVILTAIGCGNGFHGSLNMERAETVRPASVAKKHDVLRSEKTFLVRRLKK